MKNLLINIGKKSKKAFSYQLDTKKKNKVLKNYYQLIEKNKRLVINENKNTLKTLIKRN